MKVQKIAVIGAGQMGSGIAQVAANSGLQTLLFDAAPGAIGRGMKNIEKRLARGVEKGIQTEDQARKTLSLIKGAETLEALSDADIVIEAIVENSGVKCELFKQLDTILKPEAIFASNTSSISITKLAAATNRPSRVVGMHFMNPVPVMQLIEIIRGLQTSDETYEVIKETTLVMGKTPVTARKDMPGFIVNRILIPMLNEAVYVLMEGIATPEEIDTAMKLGTNQPMGPLELADFVGLDTCLAICRVFHAELGDDKYRPCPLLVKYVEAGWLGKKSGRGFYTYS